MAEATFLQRYFSFQGRVRRRQYWLFSLFQLIIAGGFAALLIGLPQLVGPDSPLVYGAVAAAIAACAVLMCVGLSYNVRRFHDRDKSGFFLLITIIPFIGPLWLFAELGFLDGTQGPNRYGPSPKGIVGEGVAEAFS